MHCRLHSCNGRIEVTVQTPYERSSGAASVLLSLDTCVPVRHLALSAFLSDSEVLYHLDISGVLQGAFVSSPITLCTPYEAMWKETLYVDRYLC